MTEQLPGRPVRVTSISFGIRPLEAIIDVVEAEAARGTDLIALPETWAGQQSNRPEALDGPIITAMADIARRHGTWIVCPIDRLDGNRRLNTAVLIGRDGKVAGTYDKVYPYWNEFDLAQLVDIGTETPVFETDFGKVGMAICFDANFPEVWKGLADNGAEMVVWPSAYSAATTLQAHALVHHFAIVSSTQTGDCIVYDIDGRELLYEKSDDVNVSRFTLDLDRGIYHENFNLEKRDRLLAERAEDVELERHHLREQWFILKARRPGVSARALAKEYGLEELRDYINRSRIGIDRHAGRTERGVIYCCTWPDGEAGDHQRAEDDGAVDRLDPERRHLRQRQQVLHDAEQQHAGQRAEHRALAAVERDAADHRRGEHGEDHAVALVGADRADIAGDREAADGGEHARQHVDAPGDALDADAGGARRLRVAADRVERPAEPVIAQHERRDQEGQRREPHGERQAEEGDCPSARRTRRAGRTASGRWWRRPACRAG